MKDEFDFIKSHIDKVYTGFNGGFFVDINESDDVISPLYHLEAKYWNGVCISDNEKYCSGRNCYVENQRINTNYLYEKDGFNRNYVHGLIAKNDKSFLYHVMYINSKNSEDILLSIFDSLYHVAYDENPDTGYWVTTSLMIIIKCDDIAKILPKCEKYFFRLIDSYNGIYVLKNYLINNI